MFDRPHRLSISIILNLYRANDFSSGEIYLTDSRKDSIIPWLPSVSSPWTWSAWSWLFYQPWSHLLVVVLLGPACSTIEDTQILQLPLHPCLLGWKRDDVSLQAPSFRLCVPQWNPETNHFYHEIPQFYLLLSM
ncbi:hypothetical protein MLD38_034975 [Melastoma candidum]|uniref:Uncharacterized protein n=1 Tax=Melastoma candidum TaxID=119954 RepID=A0ACB9MBM8_9MYRT|nr:hypothetical protein MLD38_034975 [Melastoma candidum]